MNNLQGQVAIVTGGGTGIGQSIALALAREGVQVVVCGRRLELLERTVAAIEQAGGAGLAVQADVANQHDVERLVTTTRERYGTIDILVNNAGIAGGGPIHEHSIAQWDHVMAVNLRGPFLLCRAVLPILRDQRRGHIVNISSEAGLGTMPATGPMGCPSTRSTPWRSTSSAKTRRWAFAWTPSVRAWSSPK